MPTDVGTLWQATFLCTTAVTQKYTRMSLGDAAPPPKKGIFWEFFPKGGGRVFLNPKTFVNLPSVFLYAKIILRCQNMFYNSGEVISDQFHHITLDSKSGKFWKKSAKTRSFGNFFHCEGGGSPIPKSICQNSYQKVNIFVKTKNAPNDLKCKINHTFFFGNRGSQKGERGGGVRHLGKIPKKSRLFFWGASLIPEFTHNKHISRYTVNRSWSLIFTSNS